MSRKKSGNPINGILLLDKPLGISSNAALQKTKRLFDANKAGHAGSLDPLASGMLPICFGEATKFSQFLLGADKYYQVGAVLGVKTTTFDAEGDVVITRPVIGINEKQILAVLPQFTGEISQIPPMFSAIKHEGQRLYKLARQGIEVARVPRAITIHEITLLNCTENKFSIDVRCSKGTYIRSLIDDIGETLGCGAHVNFLRRLAVAPYQDQTMFTFEQLEEILKNSGMAGLQNCLLPLDTCMQSIPKITLSTSVAFYLRQGQSVQVPGVPREGLVQLFFADNQFLGIGEVIEDGRVAPKRLVSE